MTDRGSDRALVDAIVRQLSESERSDLMQLLDVDEDAALSAAIGDHEGIRRRAAGLNDGDRSALAAIVGEHPFYEDRYRPDAESHSILRAAGLAFVVGDDQIGAEVVVPLEVRVALLSEGVIVEADLAAHLACADESEVHRLAALHGVDLEPGDLLQQAIALADAITERDAIEDLYNSLGEGSRALLFWLCERDRPATDEVIRGWRANGNSGAEDSGGGGLVLERLGLALRVETDAATAMVVPTDIRTALTPIFDDAFAARAAGAWAALRNSALPSTRDSFPRGAGGDPPAAARYRFARGMVWPPEVESNSLDALLVELHVLNGDGGSAELASWFMDVSTPDAFARTALRVWCGALDDRYTRTLLEPAGADCTLATEYILAGSGEPSLDREIWVGFLSAIRAHIVFVLGVLPANHWFRIDMLAQWLLATYQRTVWNVLRVAALGTEFPAEALPVPASQVGPHMLEGFRTALTVLAREFFEPIGAMQLDSSETLFMTNSEAFRAFREFEPWFDEVWASEEAVIGDDIDLWLPLPVDTGALVRGVADLSWQSDTVLESSFQIHAHDIVRLATWATPLHTGTGLAFVFDPASIKRGYAGDESAEDFLLWLTVRTGDVLPDALRAFFRVSSTAADSVHGAQRMAAAVALATELVEALDDWADAPPLRLMETIRSWGSAAEPAIRERLSERIEAGEWQSADARHLCVLAGEAGADSAVPLLLRALAEGDNEGVEGAASIAIARIGGAAAEGVCQLLEDPQLRPDKRMLAAGTIAGMCALHPHLADVLMSSLTSALGKWDPDDVEGTTLLAVHIAETGHPAAETLLYRVRDQGLWEDSVLPFDEVLWISSLSPAIWGHPVFAGPLCNLYPNDVESNELLKLAGVDDLLTEGGFSRDTLPGMPAERSTEHAAEGQRSRKRRRSRRDDGE